MNEKDTEDAIKALIDHNRMLEMRVAALVAFVAAVVEESPNKDVLFTRWGNALKPAVEEFAGLDEQWNDHAARVPFWVQTHKDPD